MTEVKTGKGGARKWFGTVAAAVVGGVILLIVTMWIKPEPGPPMGAKVEDVSLATGSPCCDFSYRVTIKGFIGQQISAWERVVDESSGSSGSWTQIQTFTPEANEDSASDVAHATISTPGTYHVTIALMDPKGVELSRLDSAPIDVG